MSVNATISPLQDGSYIVEMTFTDPDTGAGITPATLAWTLTTRDGTVVNNRDAVALSPSSSVVSVMLDGPDLAEISGHDLYRRFLIDGTYDNPLKAGATLKGELNFFVQRRGQKNTP